MDRDVTVREVLNREFVGASESDGLVETVEVMLAEETETVVVLRGSEPVGVLTERDVLSLLVDGPDLERATVSDAMRPTVPTIDPKATIGEAADRLSTESARRLVVSDGTETMGVLTEHDLLATRPAPTNGPEGGPRERMDAAVTTGGGAANAEGAEERFEDQSICEGCGTLTSDLASFNGQLLCSDCRDI